MFRNSNILRKTEGSTTQRNSHPLARLHIHYYLTGQSRWQRPSGASASPAVGRLHMNAGKQPNTLQRFRKPPAKRGTPNLARFPSSFPTACMHSGTLSILSPVPTAHGPRPACALRFSHRPPEVRMDCYGRVLGTMTSRRGTVRDAGWDSREAEGKRLLR
ncbi:hypothetical protein CALCODRAFT_381359 [Calocera cornea HHB12733]|uniref:Uncharacterized protein n=1 Tax=Calocera cornea HHB12733 TaxID=1353952 RepID=A0A165ED48_9BASI|nr:hypothetical protein CALCODRAFT_381359 [Calocera cornea HHB12733]